jgi:hypothetical protein
MSNHWSSGIVSLLLLTCAVALIVWHVRTWRDAREETLDSSELDYRRRQFRRRIQTSTLLAILAVAIFVGEVLTPQVGTRQFAVIYWGCVLLVLACVGVLAVADIAASRAHFSRLHQQHRAEQAKLRSELHRLHVREGNGKPGK